MLFVMSAFHIPVMQEECLTGLSINPDGVYVDLTYGGGGHSEAILAKLSDKGKLFAFDQDEEAELNAKAVNDKRLVFIRTNFRFFRKYLRMYNIEKVDGILADLGVSSHQIDDASRGFSTRYEGKLDMRMDQELAMNAARIVNDYPANDLVRILSEFGEVRNAKTLASAIVSSRSTKPIETTTDLRALLRTLAPRGRENQYYAQVFQALRIEVNQELKALEDMLQQSVEILTPGGRIVVLSYHSLEDRRVKNFFNTGNVRGEQEKDFYGNVQRPLDPVTRKPLTAGPAEINMNKRARSAKLRIAERREDG